MSPNFEEVEGAYWFGPVRLSVRFFFGFFFFLGGGAGAGVMGFMLFFFLFKLINHILPRNKLVPNNSFSWENSADSDQTARRQAL